MKVAFSDRAGPAIFFALVFCSLAVKTWFVLESSPYAMHVDEPLLSTSAARIVETGNLNPRMFLYPSLPVYLIAAAYVVTYGAERLLGITEAIHFDRVRWFPNYEIPEMVVSARLLFVLLSAFTVIFVGGIAILVLGGSGFATCAAALLLTSPLFLTHSWEYLNVDIVGAFFVLGCLFYVMWRFEKQTYVAKAIIPGVLTGLAIASKYQLALLFVPCWLALVLTSRNREFVLKATVLLVGCMTLAFFVAVPYFLFDKNYIGGVFQQFHIYGTGHPGFSGTPGLSQLWFHLRALFGEYQSAASVLGALGLISLFRRDYRRAIVLFALPLILLVTMSAQVVNFTRNLLPVYCILPVFIVAGAAFVVDLLVRASRKDALRVVGMAILLAVCIRWPQVDRLYRVPHDSRNEVVAWIEKDIPHGTTLLLAAELYIDPAKLMNHYDVRVVEFRNGSAADFMATLPDPAVMVAPVYGYDARWPEDQRISETLNSRLNGHSSLREFGSRRVDCCFSFATRHGNPKIAVRRVSQKMARSEPLLKVQSCQLGRT